VIILKLLARGQTEKLNRDQYKGHKSYILKVFLRKFLHYPKTAESEKYLDDHVDPPTTVL
jgi:hypothetical protein